MRTRSHFYARAALVVAISVALLSGCVNPANRTIRTSDAGASKVNNELDQASKAMIVDEAPVVQEYRGQYVDITPQVASSDVSTVALPCPVSFPASSLSVDAFRDLLSQGDCHIEVRFTPEALARLNGGAAVANGGEKTVDGTRIPADPAGSRATSYAAPMISINYHGDVQGVLDRAADQLGLYVKRDGNVATFFYTETRTFHINMMPISHVQHMKVASGVTAGAAGVSTSVAGSGGQGTTQTSQSAQDLTYTVHGDVAKDLHEQFQKILGDGNFAYSESDGVLVATGTPPKLDMVDELVKETNKEVTKKVKFLTTLVLFTDTKSDSMSDALNIAFNDGGRGASIGSNFPIAGSTGSTVGFVVGSNATGKLGQFAGSQITLNALRQLGVVDVLQQHLNQTVNLQPVAYQDGTDTTYLAESGNTLTSGGTATGFSQTMLIPGTVTTGLNLSMKPFVFGDGKTVEVQFSMDLSALDALTPLTSNGQTIQGPEVSKNVADQIVELRSGQTLVITGIRNHTNKSTKAGTLSPSFWGLGGGISNSEAKTVGMILITPVVE